MLAGSLDHFSLGTEIPYSVHWAKLDSIGSTELSRTPEGAPTPPLSYPTPVPCPKVLPPSTSPLSPTHPIATLGALSGPHSGSVPLVGKPRPFRRHSGTAPVHAHAVLSAQVPTTPCPVLALSSPHPPPRRQTLLPSHLPPLPSSYVRPALSQTGRLPCPCPPPQSHPSPTPRCPDRGPRVRSGRSTRPPQGRETRAAPAPAWTWPARPWGPSCAAPSPCPSRFQPWRGGRGGRVRRSVRRLRGSCSRPGDATSPRRSAASGAGSGPRPRLPLARGQRGGTSGVSGPIRARLV